MTNKQRLVIVSNRVPSVDASKGREEVAGGLVRAIGPVVERHGGLWFGWSGRTTGRRPDTGPKVVTTDHFDLATIDLSEDEVSLYYSGFCNRTLWPLMHSFPERVHVRRNTYAAYTRLNRRFADAIRGLLQPDDRVWVNDFHLFLLGSELRRLGWKGKTGFFLHVPFPPPEIFAILPWAGQLLAGLASYDLVGFQTEDDLSNFQQASRREIGGVSEDRKMTIENGSFKTSVYPIGIDPAPFQPASDGSNGAEARRSTRGRTQEQQLLLTVDRLDYSKGIPERLRAFRRLLGRYRAVRGNISLVQISQPSRARVPEYVREKEEVDRLVGQINGTFSESGWMPIRYLYRSYGLEELVQFYRAADVCLVTPLRDGMNLVAKEFVAAQDDDPGVLVLSRFCGAAESMTDALIVNPYDVDGTAAAVYRALRMPRRERVQRWEALMEVVSRDTAESWSTGFLNDLAAA